MLNLLTFIWFCLLLAFLLGLLLGYALWHGQHKPTAEAANRAKTDDDTAALKKALQEHEAQLEALKAELTTTKTERDRVRAEAVPLNTRIDELTRNLEEMTRQKAILETGPKTLGDLAAVAEERDQLRKSLAQAQEQVAAHTQALTQANANIQTANTTIQNAQTQLQSQSAELDRLRAQLNAAPTVAAPPTVAAATEAAAALPLAAAPTGLVIPPVELGRIDDLKEIIGVGPFIEAKLRALGIQTFKQIALLPPPMLEKVAESIEYFQGRIGRENWTEQCKALHFDKYGEKL